MNASDAVQQLAAKDAEIARLKALIDRDRTGLAEALAKCLGVIRGYDWLGDADECPWGFYEWNERTEKVFREEVGRAFAEITKTANDALRESGRRAFEAFYPYLAKKKT